MNIHRRGRVLVWFITTLFLIMADYASAGTPGKCEESLADCHDGNTCGWHSALCIVDLNNTGTVSFITPHVGMANVATRLNFFCVRAGRIIRWQTNGSSFDVKFRSTHKPFQMRSRFTGSAGHSDRGSADIAGCYKFSIQNCTTAINCGKVDPKVVVNGGVGLNQGPEK